MSPIPSDSPSSADRRRSLIEQGWLDEPQVQAILGTGASLDELRAMNQLLGVWDVERSKYWYPPFQFEGRALSPTILALLPFLPKGSGSGWSQAEWFYSPHALLDKETPADAFRQNPIRVIQAALREFASNPHENW